MTVHEGTQLNSIIKGQRVIALATLGVSLVIASLANPVSAGQFGVRVVDSDGMPVAGASVCFGLPGNYRQFGAIFTDLKGEAMVEVPNIPFVVTVSKTRFSGIRLNEPARNFDLIRQVTLAEGRPGPRCKAGSTLAETHKSSVRVSRVQMSTDSDRIQLIPQVSGEPTDYRLSTIPDVSFTKWQKFETSIDVPPDMALRETLYLQLRRFEGTPSGWLEATSDISTVFLPSRDPNR